MTNIMFTPVFPWQVQQWTQLTSQFPNTAHALLFAGLNGTGKHAFVQKLIAWALCAEKKPAEPACGECQSCQWLKAKTHPNYLQVTVAEDSKSDTIKVEDVRKILPFAQQSSQGTRIVFIEKAERMNVSSANALLKVLEEPPQNVLFLLTSDKPKLLLPTIHSRVQSCQVSKISEEMATAYITALPSYQAYITNSQSNISASQLLAMVGGAPLLIESLMGSAWITQRQTWLKVWQALRAGQRDMITASQYWQQSLTFDEAFQLQLLMCRDLYALHNGLPTIQGDIDFACLNPLPEINHIQKIEKAMYQSQIDIHQNIQTGYLFDELMGLLSAS